MEKIEKIVTERINDNKNKVEFSMERISDNILLSSAVGILVVAAGLKILGHRQSASLTLQCGMTLFVIGSCNKILYSIKRKKNKDPV